MSKISVADARSFAALLTSGADAAEAAGQTEFDLTGAAEAQFQSALSEAQAAINAAPEAGKT
jgi:hypothetical protein